MRIGVGGGALGLALLWATGAGASAEAGIHLTYTIYALGFRAMVMEAKVDFDGDRYQVAMSDHTVGFVSAFVTNHVASEAVGTLTGDVLHPLHFQSAGYSRGADRRTVIDYEGDRPEVSVLSPVEARRDKVPAADTVGSVDSLSAVAGLLQKIAVSGHCDSTLRIFDGARLTEIVAKTAGQVMLPKVARSPYAGAALQCDFTTQELAGFLHDDNYAKSHEPQHGTAWVAPVVLGSPPVPIRVQFTTTEHGPVSIYLQSAARQGA